MDDGMARMVCSSRPRIGRLGAELSSPSKTNTCAVTSGEPRALVPRRAASPVSPSRASRISSRR